CSVLVGRIALCTRPIPRRCGCLPQGLSDLWQERQGAREPLEAGHVAAAVGPEGRCVFVLQRTHHQVSERTDPREVDRPDGAPTRGVLTGASGGTCAGAVGSRRPGGARPGGQARKPVLGEARGERTATTVVPRRCHRLPGPPFGPARRAIPDYA